MLMRVTTADDTTGVMQRALRVSGLTHATSIDERDMLALLHALAAEGGAIQELAQDIALNGIDPEPRAA